MEHQEIWKTKEPVDIVFSPRVVPPGYVPYHWHDAYEFNFEIEGSFQVMIHHDKYVAGPGDFFAINPGEPHSFVSEKGDTSITMIIPSNFFKRFAPNEPLPVFPNVFSKEQKAVIGEWLMRCNHLYEASLESNFLDFYGELFYLLSYLYQQRKKDARLEQIALSDTQKHRLEILTSYIEEHYNESIGLNDAAGILHLQPNYFCRFFKKLTGMSFMEYLNDYRIIKIYRDIIDTDDSIRDIIIRHGFDDYKIFRKYFYRRYQATPSHVRKFKVISQYSEKKK